MIFDFTWVYGNKNKIVMVKEHWNKVCAFCGCMLDEKSKEHIFPKSVGGTTTVSDFICGSCNNKKGTKWDSVLEEELRPWIICFGLSDKVIAGETENGEQIYFHPESGCFRYDKDSTFDKFDIGGYLNLKEMVEEMIKSADANEKKEVNVSGTIYREGDLKEVRKSVNRINKRYRDKGVRINFNTSLNPAKETKFKINCPTHLRNPQSICSAIKTCLATLYYASYSRQDIRGVGIDQCDMIKGFLLSEGRSDQVYIKEIPIVKDGLDITLVDLFFPPPVHRVTWIGDSTGKLIARICYFSRIEMEIIFSVTYRGPIFDFNHQVWDSSKFVKNMFNRYGAEKILEAFGL